MASRWDSSALSSTTKPMFAFVPSSQMLPSKVATAAKLSPSRVTSPNLPSSMCQISTPAQSPSVGGWANVQGHGMVHLQTSNQSPLRCQLGASDNALTSIELVDSRFLDPLIGPAARQPRAVAYGTRWISNMLVPSSCSGSPAV